MHQRFSNHKTLFKHFPSLNLETKIKLYTIKVFKNLEDAQFLSKNENVGDERDIISDKSSFQTNDIDYDSLIKEIKDLESLELDYETIHSEILNNIIFEENDSGLSDFDDKETITENKESTNRNNTPIFDIPCN